MDPLYILVPVVFIMFVLIFAINSYSSIEILLFVFIIMVVSVIGAQYFFGINLTATIQNLFTKPEVDIAIVQSDKSSKPPSPIPSSTNLDTTIPQTFHVEGNFNYIDAKAVCKAYNSKMANIKQVTDAYDKGAEWCDYGWSTKHMVLYPTQYKSWKSYQELGKKEQCGRPGINGGYNHNLLQELGVNCFGNKPKINGPMPEKTIPHEIVDKRVKYWQSKIPSLTVAPFNYDSWSE